mgnify:CR=1 FL=1
MGDGLFVFLPAVCGSCAIMIESDDYHSLIVNPYHDYCDLTGLVNA